MMQLPGRSYMTYGRNTVFSFLRLRNPGRDRTNGSRKSKRYQPKYDAITWYMTYGRNTVSSFLRLRNPGPDRTNGSRKSKRYQPNAFFSPR